MRRGASGGRTVVKPDPGGPKAKRARLSRQTPAPPRSRHVATLASFPPPPRTNIFRLSTSDDRPGPRMLANEATPTPRQRL
ncbi:hypothetical protein NL676_023401 [Syzygium grande]|nr:hypothetical protein NL676_023401 [Syzygium grande]